MTRQAKKKHHHTTTGRRKSKKKAKKGLKVRCVCGGVVLLSKSLNLFEQKSKESHIHRTCSRHLHQCWLSHACDLTQDARPLGARSPNASQWSSSCDQTTPVKDHRLWDLVWNSLSPLPLWRPKMERKVGKTRENRGKWGERQGKVAVLKRRKNTFPGGNPGNSRGKSN